MKHEHNIHVRLIIGAGYEPIELIKHKIAFLNTLPVSCIYTLLHYKTDQLVEPVVKLLHESGINNIMFWKAARFTEPVKVRKMDKMVRHLPPEDWIINSDCDEFPDFGDDPERFFQDVISSGSDYLQGALLDRVAESLHVTRDIADGVDLKVQFPVNVNMHGLKYPKYVERHCTKLPGVNECLLPKVVMHRAKVRCGKGYHKVNNKRLKKYETVIPVYHFKWFGNVVQKMEQIEADVVTAHKTKMIQCVRDDNIKSILINYPN